MSYYVFNIEVDADDSVNYREVIYTTETMQLVTMCLIPGEDIPSEIHEEATQFIRVESGRCQLDCDDESLLLTGGGFAAIRPGVSHYVKNLSETESLVLTIQYSPPQHAYDLKQVRQY